MILSKMLSPFVRLAAGLSNLSSAFSLPQVLSSTSALATSRIAVPADIDELVDAVLLTMPADPQWDYRFPYRLQYPEEHRKYTKMLWEKFIDPAYDDWVVQVVEDKLPGASKPVLVAFSVWNVSYLNKRKHGPSYEPQSPPREVAENGGATRKDANPAHVRAFKESSDECDKKYLDVYGDDQLILQILGTHPDYRRRGHGTTLCKWGMDLARRDGVVLTLQASPLGRLLYSSLGFTNLGECVMQVPGEDEYVPFWAMVWPAQRAEL